MTKEQDEANARQNEIIKACEHEPARIGGRLQCIKWHLCRFTIGTKMNDGSQVFVKCVKCGERWKIATLPLDVTAFCKMTRNVHCPNCAAGGRNDIVMAMEDVGEIFVAEKGAGK